MTHIRSKLTLVFLFAGVVAAFAWWGTSLGIDQGSSGSTAVEGPSPRPTDWAGNRLVAGAVVAEQERAPTLRHYVAQLHNDFRQEGGQNDSLGMLFGFEGQLVMGEIERSEGLSWSYLELGSLLLAGDGDVRTGLTDEQRAAAKRELEQGYFVGRDARGQIREYRFSGSRSAMTEGLLRALAVTTQRVVPEDTVPSGKWTVMEVDGVGEAKVRYEQIGRGTWQKSKGSYERLLSEAGLAEDADDGMTRTLLSTGRLAFEGARLQSASLKETSSASLDGTTMVNHAEVVIEPGRGGQTRSLAALRRLLHRLTSVSAYRLPSMREVPQEQRLREVLGERSFEQLLGELETLEPGDEVARRTLLEQLEADLQLMPDDATRLVAQLAAGGANQRSVVLSALANADTRQASAALREVARDVELPDPVRESATALLGFSRNGDQATVNHLSEVSEDEDDPQSGTATLALGNLVEGLRESDPSGAEDVIEQLLHRLGDAGDESSQVQLLGALGNTGDARLLDDLAAWRGSPSAPVRAAAYRALRLIGSESALMIMAEGVLGDAEASVRAETLRALAARPSPGAVALALRSLGADPEAWVRLEALGIVGMFPVDPHRDALASVSEGDPDEQVRTTAAELLQRATRPPA